MSAKPTKQNEAPKPTKARLWAALRQYKARELDIKLLSDYARVDPEAARHHLDGWVNAGVVERTEGKKVGASRQYLYRLVKDMGVDAPLVNPDGSPLVLGVKNANMWRTMRMLKTFDFRTVEAHASTSTQPIILETVRTYVRALQQAGYLTVVKPAQGKGKNATRTPAVYFLAKDTGPKPPMIQKLKTVYDQNLNKVMWMEEAGNE